MAQIQQQGTTIVLEHQEVRFVKATECHMTLVPSAAEPRQETTVLGHFSSLPPSFLKLTPVSYSLPL